MKKILLTLIAVAFVSSLCFVAEPSANADEAKTFTGKVESIQKGIAKPPKWTYTRITFVTDSGEKILVHAIQATKVIDLSGKDITEGGKIFAAVYLKKGQRVEVKYSI